MSNCGQCRYLDITPDADGKIRVRRGQGYGCNAPTLDAIPAGVPISAGSYFFGDILRQINIRRLVEPDMGEGCNCFKKRVK